MSENNKTMPFASWLDLNNPIFYKLEEKISLLLDKESNEMSRKLQIRTLVYVNFNNYLTLLLAKNEKKIETNTLDDLMNAAEDNRLELIAATINSSAQKIISDFINLLTTETN